jgi:light-regulated signal transduction histidine kinase (bacteriophytochrome)
VFWNELMISPVKDAFGNITHFVGIQNDVTKRVVAELQLEKQRDQLDEKVRERTNTLEESEAYLSAIVETIRESLVVLDSQFRNLSANHNFCDFFKDPEGTILGRNLFEIGSGKWNLPELRELLTKVLRHNNPFEGFSEIKVHISSMSGYCKIAISDQGIGINMKDHKRIFERFYRAEEISEKFPGVGVGLYVCNEIIKEHNGTLWVESEAGKGSTFSFTIPIAKNNIF